MTTATSIRRSKQAQIEEFFAANIGVKFSSSSLHQRFGSAFRSRLPAIRRSSDCAFDIKNETRVVAVEGGGIEKSWYWAERRVRNAAEQLELISA